MKIDGLDEMGGVLAHQADWNGHDVMCTLPIVLDICKLYSRHHSQEVSCSLPNCVFGYLCNGTVVTMYFSR